ncbi:8-oxo-dGTP pyrophosphatase MutT (NUDIX family) [Pontibacter aydingkolensis]|uniref:NUDIX hydrolase n=1 Tax=Pontibacter aydingkolensis TaxID=1911536 RepID=A0ABS7CP72_9BACT|nr:NUDIX hydrolase [Pontibacter aydingkolensis]MBW7465619.1 NUDIX hydrolase [Pontibacter aydingkolensis]
MEPDAPKPKLPVVDQVSSGGVAYRKGDAGVEVALISVGQPAHWQLPKGIVDPGETPEITAVREVQEETGISTELIKKLETIEYWYVGNKGQQRVRFHKFVHFFLLAYSSGDLGKHDWEVNEARWVSIQEAEELLAFKSERQVVAKAALLIKSFNKV